MEEEVVEEEVVVVLVRGGRGGSALHTTRAAPIRLGLGPMRAWPYATLIYSRIRRRRRRRKGKEDAEEEEGGRRRRRRRWRSRPSWSISSPQHPSAARGPGQPTRGRDEAQQLRRR